MDTLEAPSASGDQPVDHMQAEYVRQKPLNLDEERQRQESWWEDGECPGPNHVAVIRLTNEQIDLLKRSLTFEHTEFGTPVLDEDDQVAADAAKQDGVPVLDPAAREVLRKVVSLFEQVVQDDLQRNGIVQTDTPTLRMQAGLYTDDDEDLHVDDPGTFAIRYGVTVIGPGTEWPRDSVDPNGFDISAGDYIAGVPLTGPREYSEAGTVEQFMTGCDPHTPAVIDSDLLATEDFEPPVRITLFSTISV